MSASRENIITLNSDIVRAGYNQNQDKSAIELFIHFLVGVLESFFINDNKMEDLEDEFENILIGYSLYIKDTNTPKNHQAYTANNNKDPTGHLKYIILAEYLRKAINLMRSFFPNRELSKDDEALADILGSNFKKSWHRIQQGKYNIFGQETKICIYYMARHCNSDFTPHWANLMNCEEICKMTIKETFDGDVYNRLKEKRLMLFLTKT